MHLPPRSSAPRRRRRRHRCSPRSRPAHPPQGSCPRPANSRSRTGSQTAGSPGRSCRSTARRRRRCRRHIRSPAHAGPGNLRAGRWYRPNHPPPRHRRRRRCRPKYRAAHRQRCLPRRCRRCPRPLHRSCQLAPYQRGRCRQAPCPARRCRRPPHRQTRRTSRPMPHRPPAQKPAALSRSPTPATPRPTTTLHSASTSAHSCLPTLLSRIGCDLPQDC